MLEPFHFLRPGWLLALPVGLAAIVLLFRAHASGGAWRRVVDRPLQPLVLTGADRHTGRRWPLVIACAAWAVATLALAGPAWERLPVPAFRSNEALVVALDLSRSMDAGDLAPSRLSRAKLKLLSLLERRRGGQTGLVVFSAHAFTVTPLTTDTRTVASLVAALGTDIMPSRGSRPEAGIEKAAALLRQARVTDGRILLMTDASPSAEALALAHDLDADGVELNVLGVGTPDGAPIPLPDGGFVTDDRGNVAVPKIDPGALARLAGAGGGRFSTLTADDADLDRLEPPQDAAGIEREAPEEDPRYADVWRDAGIGLAVLLLPLVALGFRRGWVAALACCVLIPEPAAFAQAPTDGEGEPAAGGADEGASLTDLWQSLWRRPDQRGAAEMTEQRPERAAELFEDPQWRAAAQYRAGEYADSAASLAGVETADAHYNRGNALARAGRVAPAIAAYDRALELDPQHEDARYNRALLEQIREQQSQQAQQGSQGEQSPSQQAASGEQPEQAPSGGEEQAGGEAQSPQGEGEDGPSRAQEPPPAGGQSPQDAPGEPEPGQRDRFAEADAPAQDPSEDRNERDGEGAPEAPEGSAGEAEGEAGAAPADLEQWASDQAAEQWLRRIEQDPGGLLRRKFLYQYQRLGVDQDGNDVRPEDDEEEAW